MTDTAMVPAAPDDLTAIEQVLVNGNLAGLNPEQRVIYYNKLCETLGLNPYTKPFQYIMLQGKLTLYATKDCGDQLRKNRSISVIRMENEVVSDLFVTRAYGRDGKGREDVATGAVSIAGLKGENLANAMMKSETKAKRRLALSLAGLGFLDEIEIEGAQAGVDPNTGEITDEPPTTLADAVTQKLAAVTQEIAPQASENDATAISGTDATDDAADVDLADTVPDIQPTSEPVQCESLSNIDQAQCRKEAGHKGPHRTENQSWPQ